MAGERLVLAELIVDSNGVVKGVKDATEAFKFLPDNLEKHGKKAADTGDRYLGALEHRFFGFRHVAGALLGGFTVAGVVVELEKLGLAILALDPAFSELEKATASFGQQFVSLAHSAAGLGPGLEEATTWTDRLTASMRAMEEVAEAHPEAAAAGRQGMIAGLLFGMPGVNMLVSNLGLTGAALDKLLKKQIDAVKAMRQFADPNAIKLWEDAITQLDKQMTGLETRGANVGKLTAGIKIAPDGSLAFPAQRIDDKSPAAFLGPLHDTGSPLHGVESNLIVDSAGIVTANKNVAKSFDLVHDAIIGNQGALQQWGETVGVVVKEENLQVIHVLTPMQSAFEGIADGIDLATGAVQLFETAVAAMGAALADSLVGGGQSMRQAMGQMMKDLARMALTYALMNLAVGAMASTPWGTAIFGPPAQYFHAAALFGAVGVAAAGAARAFGSGSDSGSAGASAGGAAAAAGAASSPPSRSITVVIEGNSTFIGTSEAAVARWFVKAARQAQLDGA